MFGVGIAMLVLSMTWPERFYPFLWGSAFFLAEPVNARRGRSSLLTPLARGGWHPAAALTEPDHAAHRRNEDLQNAFAT